jgi:hypothetical protein
MGQPAPPIVRPREELMHDARIDVGPPAGPVAWPYAREYKTSLKRIRSSTRTALIKIDAIR